MPSCNGPPDGPCPYNAKGDMVHFNYAELDLCDECEKEHRETFSHTSVKSVNTLVNNNVQGPTTRQNESADCTQSLLMDSVLSYIVFSLQSASVDNVKRAVLGYFSEDEIVKAKDKLWNKCGSEIIGDKPRRKDSSVRSSGEAYVCDILSALVKLDKADKTPHIVISAYSLGSIPRSHPEELNNISLLDRLNQLEKRMSNQAIKH